MNLAAQKADLKDIQSLRALFLQENNFQIRYDSCYARGWTDSYLLFIDDLKVGYGSIWGMQDRDTLFEYFVLKPFRRRASELFRALLDASKPRRIECQSNALLVTSMLYEACPAVSADVILFEDHVVTEHAIPGAVFRPKRSDDRMIDLDADAGYVVEMDGEVVAGGGFLLHYNKPFADLYMAVREPWRRRGVGSFLLQEIKKECYLAGRCNMTNPASRATLMKAGLRVCGFMLSGNLE